MTTPSTARPGAPSSTLTVFLAPDGPAAGVRDVLTDLSAAGLVSDFLWVVDADMAFDEYDNGPPDVAAVRISRGVSEETTLSAAMADIRHTRRRLCVVVPVSDGQVASFDAEQRLSNIVISPRVPSTRIRVIIARPGDHIIQEVLSRNGWQNVYVAPEDARGPALDPQLLAPDADPVEVGRLAAPAVAGLVGLWVGVDRTPLDDPHTPDGVRAGRVFYRRIDARAVEAELRSRVLSTGVPLPEPTDHTANAPAVYAPDQVRACTTMAGNWWGKHRRTLRGERRTWRPTPPRKIRGWTLLMMFLRFLKASLLSLPYDIVHNVVITGKAGAARQVHRLVLGSGGDPAYEVVVGGVDRNRMPVSWQTLGRGIHEIDNRLALNGERGLDEQPPRPDLRNVWLDYAYGAMSLIDGGRRTLPVLSDNANVFVLRSTALAAPAPEDDFPIPGHFHTDVGAEPLQVGDVLGADVLRRRLGHLHGDHRREADSSGTLQDLDNWQNRHRHSYSAQVGARLATNLFEVVDEIRGILRWLKDAADQVEPQQARPSRGRVWVTWLLGLLALLGLVAGPVLRWQDRVPTWAAVAIAVVPLTVWLVVTFVGYVGERQKIFAEMHRREQLESRVEVERANLRQATIDAGRLAMAYEQYLVWSRVVGALLNRPFGPPRPAVDGAADITYGLPRTTRIARAQVDEHATSDAAAALRADLFTVGWLREPWEAHLAGAGRQLGLYHLTSNPQKLLDLQGGVADSDLLRWSRLLADPDAGPSSGPGDAAWERGRALLHQRHQALADKLFSDVREVESGIRNAVALDDFLCGIDRSASPGERRDFGAVHFTAGGQTAGHGRVTEHVPMHAPLGLSRVDVLVQLTNAWEPWFFAVTERPRRRAEEPAAPPPFPYGATAGNDRPPTVAAPAPSAPEAPSGFH